METKILCLLLLTAAGVSLGAPAGSPEPSATATDKADATKDALADGAAGYRPDVHAADAGGDESSKATVGDGAAGSRPALYPAAAGVPGPETTAVGRVAEILGVAVAATPFMWASQQIAMIGSLLGGIW